jgi:hypothetical protein
VRVQPGGVENGDRRVLGSDEQVDLGAAEQDALGAAVGELGDDPLILRARVVGDDAEQSSL